MRIKNTPELRSLREPVKSPTGGRRSFPFLSKKLKGSTNLTVGCVVLTQSKTDLRLGLHDTLSTISTPTSASAIPSAISCRTREIGNLIRSNKFHSISLHIPVAILYLSPTDCHTQVPPQKLSYRTIYPYTSHHNATTTSYSSNNRNCDHSSGDGSKFRFRIRHSPKGGRVTVY